MLNKLTLMNFFCSLVCISQTMLHPLASSLIRSWHLRILFNHDNNLAGVIDLEKAYDSYGWWAFWRNCILWTWGVSSLSFCRSSCQIYLFKSFVIPPCLSILFLMRESYNVLSCTLFGFNNIVMKVPHSVRYFLKVNDLELYIFGVKLLRGTTISACSWQNQHSMPRLASCFL